MTTFEVTVTTTKVFTFTEGWGVSVIPIHDADDDGNDLGVSDVDVLVVPITEAGVSIIGGAPCVKDAEGDMWVPVENFSVEPSEYDRYDDARLIVEDRWFATETEAREYADGVLARWNNPAPWESFIYV